MILLVADISNYLTNNSVPKKRHFDEKKVDFKLISSSYAAGQLLSSKSLLFLLSQSGQGKIPVSPIVLDAVLVECYRTVR
jgi:hypothetical protein